MANVHHFKVKAADGSEVDLSHFQGKVLLIVNTASQCGFTPQYQELEQLYQQYQSQGLEILAFPCNQFGGQEPGTDAQIQQFCQLNFGATFPVMAKIPPESEYPKCDSPRAQASLFVNRALFPDFPAFHTDHPRR